MEMSTAAAILSNAKLRFAKAAEVADQTWLPNGTVVPGPSFRNRLKQALLQMPWIQDAVLPPQAALQQLQQFSQANPHVAGSGVPQTGLDQPGKDTRAAALPGSPGHSAINVIDQRGALDPRGLTVDGNNAAGLKKAQVGSQWANKLEAMAARRHEGGSKAARVRKFEQELMRALGQLPGEKTAAEMGDPGAVSTAVADTAGRAGSLLMMFPWLVQGGDAFRNPRKNKDKHEAVLDMFNKARPDALSDTELRLGSGNIWQDVVWKPERNGPLPWYKQLGGRVLHNKRTGPLGKLLGMVASPMYTAASSLGRIPVYDPFSDAVNNPANNEVMTSQRLGDAVAHNSLTGKGKVYNSSMARAAAGTVRDLYQSLSVVPGGNTVKRLLAAHAAKKVLQDQSSSKEDYAKKRLAQRGTIAKDISTTAITNIMSDVLPPTPEGAALRLLLPAIGAIYGRTVNKHLTPLQPQEAYEKEWEWAKRKEKPRTAEAAGEAIAKAAMASALR